MHNIFFKTDDILYFAHLSHNCINVLLNEEYSCYRRISKLQGKQTTPFAHLCCNLEIIIILYYKTLTNNIDRPTKHSLLLTKKVNLSSAWKTSTLLLGTVPHSLFCTKINPPIFISSFYPLSLSLFFSKAHYLLYPLIIIRL